ncbi:uncharacterized protein J4E87_004400 [Alternaria ethzedia]|uniref:uncharacterized protein n=1 Tax=Alternaria ethzedia TaxID=181014 RepID=UPI0020C1F9C9|nr:uncharacterized protein J4E87_004400 [Alternaria ethzedia]KAI4627058.1 hypothetical protein J4E87_004400 [Alternaria ethzedia]
MAVHQTTKDTFGPGTFVDRDFIGVPADASRLLKHLAGITPGFTTEEAALNDVEFSGGELPIIPGPLKSQVFSAVLHAMIGIVAKEISALKGIQTGSIHIDTDKCGLYPATVALVDIDGKGLGDVKTDGTLIKASLDVDKGCVSKNHMYIRSWAIYPTRDPRVWYQVMSNLNAPAFFKAYDIDGEAPVGTREEAYELIKSTISKYSAAELDIKNMENGFCGQTCFRPQHWAETSMGKRLATHPLIDYAQVKGTSALPPVLFPQTGDARPLAGIKVVELARVIAGPAMGAALAALGADVIKVQSPDLPDLQPLSITLTAGKRTYALDLQKEDDRQALTDLMADADVIIQAFRLRSLERKGFGLQDLVEMSRQRNKGIVYIDLNTYGPDGYYAERPGFQQIADAASGCSYVCGKAYGFEDGVSVLPALPVADMLAGAVGVVNVLLALRDRATKGGSYHATSVLTSVDVIQLGEAFGLYSPDTVKRIQDKYGFKPMTPDLHVEDLLYILGEAWSSHSDLLRRDGYMTTFDDTAYGKKHSILSPIVRFDNDDVSPRWSHGPVGYCSSKYETWA